MNSRVWNWSQTENFKCGFRCVNLSNSRKCYSTGIIFLSSEFFFDNIAPLALEPKKCYYMWGFIYCGVRNRQRDASTCFSDSNKGKAGSFLFSTLHIIITAWYFSTTLPMIQLCYVKRGNPYNICFTGCAKFGSVLHITQVLRCRLFPHQSWLFLKRDLSCFTNNRGTLFEWFATHYSINSKG
jgi:hypothetical protein